MLRRRTYEDLSDEERAEFNDEIREELADVQRQINDAAAEVESAYREFLYQVVDNVFSGKVNEKLVARAYADIVSAHAVSDETLAAIALELPGAGTLYDNELSKIVTENTFGRKEYWRRIGKELLGITRKSQ